MYETHFLYILRIQSPISILPLIFLQAHTLPVRNLLFSISALL